MNLTNFRATPVGRVVEVIRREAIRYGVAIHHTELVGLIPQEALVDAAQWYLQLDQFNPEQILEKRLMAAEGEEEPAKPEPGKTIEGEKDSGKRHIDFLDALADGTAAPGGGSAAAYSGAAAAALVCMVARLTIGKKKYADAENQMQAILTEAEELRSILTQAIQRDAEAFEAVMEAFKLPKETSEDQAKRAKAIQEATFKASLEPAGVARQAVRVLELVYQVVSAGNINAITDAGAGAYLAVASLRGAGLNVRTNLKSLERTDKTGALLEELRTLEGRAEKLLERIEIELQERGGLARV
jgi:glutamate formiminotransferase / formiminotetrahydrofolate cyclodeaminase